MTREECERTATEFFFENSTPETFTVGSFTFHRCEECDGDGQRVEYLSCGCCSEFVSCEECNRRGFDSVSEEN